ncbi:CapA family protein [Ornithinibacillus halophilus]|uniref:Poly-gamma-glutamate synthesis protein (Capsule biosynthesis protein) n=2 Tax=Ornithinibacillus halophilus TaxID=930117 RepID=A0A1M5GWT4_9BACI|nr:CapA family protein [Ornithinibacillus halophilus]SHG08234.1 poly-gamma-glutamate synthesis protein (capsule biosynthesis protein) [Ornithinibacillus halophilus]
MKRFGSVGIILILIILSACSINQEEQIANHHIEKNMEAIEYQAPKPIEREITFSAIGDILIHGTVYNDARTENGFDFKPMIERVKPYLSDTTISIANQETMIGGEELGLSTYPTFNSPTEVGDALKWAGINVVTLANNHTLDRGEEAIQRAIEHWETIDMMYTGAYKDEMDREQLRVFETDEGISVALLSYTYGTNGIPVPIGKDYLVNLIDQQLIAMEIEEAKEKADVVALSLHFGNEYERLPNQFQKDLVQFASDQGVDVVIGHHPHVLQPIEWVTGENGNKTLVAYSLGNFLSGQDKFYRQIGGVFKFSVKKTTEGRSESIEVHSPKFLPTYVKNTGRRNFEVIPMYQLTESDLPNASYHYEEIKEHMAQWLPELEFIEG